MNAPVREVAAWPFGNMRPLSYGVILADPPWRFRTWGEHNQKKSASRHYALMTMEAMKALPVSQLATDHSVLVMYAVPPMLPHALELMAAWGFRYKTFGAWAKQSKTARSWAFGTGYIFRSACEPYLVGTIGEPQIGARNVRNLIVAPIREHSRKPDEMHGNLERLFPCVRRAELFAREARPGWDSWGAEVGKFDPIPANASSSRAGVAS